MLWSVLATPARPPEAAGPGGQVAAEMVVFGSLLMFAAPLVLMSGFRRGDNAVLPEGKRFVVYVQRDTIVKIQSPLTGAQPGAP